MAHLSEQVNKDNRYVMYFLISKTIKYLLIKS